MRSNKHSTGVGAQSQLPIGITPRPHFPYLGQVAADCIEEVALLAPDGLWQLRVWVPCLHLHALAQIHMVMMQCDGEK